ncbi:MAG TPA: DUF1684 domain-containing protein [Gemmatimonadales bacterium]|nr:DUF1684 domain-containing protein [Gemmatimonadales bacterium]
MTLRLALALLAVPLRPLPAQSPPDLERERREFALWLRSAPVSPYAAVARIPVGTGVTLGPADADVPLPRAPLARVTESRGALTLEAGGSRLPLPRHRATPLGPYRLRPSGPPGRTVLTVFEPGREAKAPSYYPYAADLVFSGPLTPATERRTHRVLALDGGEVEAVEVGTVTIPLGGGARLRVYRIPDPSSEETELVIYFRDRTNGAGTYPAGRFVSLMPLPDGRYRLDFNRARNPFCAYSSIYPCPAPWPGNGVDAEVRAGERYEGGGLEIPELP